MPQIQVRDKRGVGIPDIRIRWSLGDAPSDAALDDKTSDDSGNLSFVFSMKSDKGYTLYVNDTDVKKEWEFQSLHVDSLDRNDLVITLNRSVRERAFISGFYSNVFLKGESAFLDLARLSHGQDIRPMLDQSVSLGSNGRRNFLMTVNTAQAAGLPPFNPDDFPNFFDKLEELLTLYSEYGLYLYGSVFPDNGLLSSWSDTQKQVNHWNHIGSIAQRYTNFWGLELTNEINAKSYNRVAQSWFTPIPGVICCSGSWTDDSGSPLVYPIQFDIADFHQRRDYPKSVVDSAVANYPFRERGKAVLLGEPIGFGIGNNREGNPRIAKEIAGSGRGTACGMIFHSVHGGFSQTYDSVEMECARAWFKELQGA